MSTMAYAHTNSRGQTYYLHSRAVKLRGGMDVTIYFFAKEVKAGALDAIPAGKMVVENKKTGLPLLKNTEKKK